MGQIEIRRGPAGSGKSAQIAAEIAQLVDVAPLGPAIYWIVPPAASYETERRLLSAVETTVRAEVLHLERLANRIHAAVGGIRETAVNTTGKRLLLAAAYHELADNLSVLHRVSPSTSFLDAILDVFREMADFLIAPSQIESALETAAAAIARVDSAFDRQAGRSLLGKLRDICLLYVGWQRMLTERNLYDPNALLTKLTPHLSEWRELRGATVFIDGFTSLTLQQIAFVVAIAAQAERTVITLPVSADVTCEEAEAATASLLTLREEIAVPTAVWTWQMLREAAERAGVTHIEAPLPADSPRFQSAPDLACLERLLYTDAQVEASVEPAHLRLLTGQSLREEVTGAAVAICEWVAKHKLNYRDVLVLVPDETRYLPVVQRVFSEYGIPFHADDAPALSSHPLARFLLAAMDVVREQFNAASMTRFLRSPFSGFSLAEVDWFERYLGMYEVAMHSWRDASPWHHAEDNREDDRRVDEAVAADARAERFRQRVLRLLAPVSQPLSEALCTPKKLAQALWLLLERAGAKQEIAEWIVGSASVDNPMQASLHEQAWLMLVDVVNDLTETLPDVLLPTPFLLELMEDALTDASLMMVPEGLDEVAVITYDRAVWKTAKFTAILGAEDGTLPPRIHQDGILLDEERALFRSVFGVRLGFTTEERQAAARQIPYFAVTRASEGVLLTHPIANEVGKAVRPSRLVNRIQTMFATQISASHHADEFGLASRALEEPYLLERLTPAGAWAQMIPDLRDGAHAATFAGIGRSVLRAHEDAHPVWLERTLAGWRHQTVAGPLSPALANRLYGSEMYMNVHQLETFAACGYRHYAMYGLRLREEQTADITAAVRGTLMHDAVERFVRLQMSDGARMASLSDEEAVLQMDTIFTDLMDMPKMQIWLRRSTRIQQAVAVRDVLRSAAIVLTRHARHGAFRPQAIELSFGTGDDAELDSWQVELSDGVTLHLRGRIDRVDSMEAPDGRAWFRVIDYKSSRMDLDLSKVAHGLQLQLPVYALVLAQTGGAIVGDGSRPAGLIYLPLRHDIPAKAAPETVEQALQTRLSAMRAKGQMVADAAVIDAMDERIAAGTSDLFRKMYTKDGAFLKSAPVLSQTDWDFLLAEVQNTIATLASRVHAGEIDIRPMRYGSEEACTYCAMATLCGLDRQTDDALFRTLPKLTGNKMQTWRTWTGKEQNADG